MPNHSSRIQASGPRIGLRSAREDLPSRPDRTVPIRSVPSTSWQRSQRHPSSDSAVATVRCRVEDDLARLRPHRIWAATRSWRPVVYAEKNQDDTHSAASLLLLRVCLKSSSTFEQLAQPSHAKYGFVRRQRNMLVFSPPLGGIGRASVPFPCDTTAPRRGVAQPTAAHSPGEVAAHRSAVSSSAS